MRPRFDVTVVSTEAVHELPGAWSTADFGHVLTALDFDDAASVADAEVRDLCLMALTDLEPEEAARVLLQHRLGDRLRKGQIDDVSHDMVDEPLWEDYPDMSVHEELYNVNQLLYDAYNGRFPRPRAVRLELEVKARDEDGAWCLEKPSDALVVRLVAGGLGEDSLFHRLFEDQVGGAGFPEAASIVWRCENTSPRDGEARLVLYGSAYWLKGLSEGDGYDTVAFPDSSETFDDPNPRGELR